jgi:predicted PurR-regulated permease PerM
MTENESSVTIPELSNRSLILATLTVVGVILLFYLIFRFYQTIFIFFVALVISTAIQPGVNRLRQWGLSRPLSVGLIFGLIGLIFTLFFIIGVPLIIEQTATISLTLAELYTGFREALVSNSNIFIWRLGRELPPVIPLQPTPNATEERELVIILEQARLFITGTGQAALSVAATFLLAFYWSLDGERVKRTLLLLIPLDRRTAARDTVAEMEGKVGAYAFGQAVLCGAIGLMAFIAYLLIGLPYSLVLALFAGLMELLPIIGPVLGALPAVIIALTISPATAVWVIVATLIIQQLENSVLVPRVMNRAVGVNPLVTLLSLIAFGSLFGIAGAVVAIPLAAVLQLLINRHLLDLQLDETTQTSGQRDFTSLLRYRTKELMQDLRRLFRKKPEALAADQEEVEDSLEAIAQDLDSFLAQGNRSNQTPDEVVSDKGSSDKGSP